MNRTAKRDTQEKIKGKKFTIQNILILDGQPFTSCTSPVVYDRLNRSTHEVTIRSTDAVGNIGEDQFTWTIRNPSAAAPERQ